MIKAPAPLVRPRVPAPTVQQMNGYIFKRKVQKFNLQVSFKIDNE